MDLGPQPIPGLTGPRRVQVFLPPGAGAQPLPVLYLWDGQNVFDDAGSFAGGWRVHEAMRARVRRGRRPAVIVAVDHGHEHRIGDYAPFGTKRFGPGRADLLLAWVADVLVPRIARELPVRAGPEHTLVGGSSMGGLVSLWALLTRPDVFGRALVMSPSLFLARDGILSRLARHRLPAGHRLYLDGGEREMNGAFRAELPRVAAAALHAGLRDDDVRVRVDPKGRHTEADWRRRLPRALDFLLRLR